MSNTRPLSTARSIAQIIVGSFLGQLKKLKDERIVIRRNSAILTIEVHAMDVTRLTIYGMLVNDSDLKPRRDVLDALVRLLQQEGFHAEGSFSASGKNMLVTVSWSN